MAFTVNSFPTGSLLTSAKMTSMQDNDNEVLQQVSDVSSGHRHDGIDSLGPLPQTLFTSDEGDSWFETAGSKTIRFYVPPSTTFINVLADITESGGGQAYVVFNTTSIAPGGGVSVTSWAVNSATMSNTWASLTYGNASGGTDDRVDMENMSIVTFPNTGW